MATLLDWLFHDDQKVLYESLVALALALLFSVLTLPVLWPLGHLSLLSGLAKGYVVLWLAVWGSVLVGALLRRGFRIDMYHRATAYVIAGLLLGGALQLGWSAFAALEVQDVVAGGSLGRAVLLYLIGALSCVVGGYAISTVYQGTIYRLANLALAVIGFAVFSVWPRTGGALYGWFFRLF